MNKLLYIFVSVLLVGCGGGSSTTENSSTSSVISNSSPASTVDSSTPSNTNSTSTDTSLSTALTTTTDLLTQMRVLPGTSDLSIPSIPTVESMKKTANLHLLAQTPTGTSPTYQWYTVATENAAFNVKGTLNTRFGSGNTWIEKTFTDVSVPCTNVEYGKDPLYGTVKSCQVYATSNPNAVYSWYTVATENTSFMVVGTQKTRYGSGNNWINKTYTDSTVPCTNIEYGKDPLYGIVKSCQIYATVAPTIPITAKYSWYKVSSEDGKFTVTGTQKTRFGFGNNWIEKSYTNTTVPCTNIEYGKDPSVGIVKECDVYATAAPIVPTPTTFTGPYINNALIPARAVGYNSERIETVFYHVNDWTIAPECTTVGGNCMIPDAMQVAGPHPNDIGAFREPCDFAAMAYDDPIVFPGKSGASHLHTFFGNTGVSANTTTANIATTGNSTCAGGIANKTAYWVPTMIDTKDGTPLVPSANLVYYKCTYSLPLAIGCDQMQALPTGLRMITGSASNSDPKATTARYICMGVNGENPGWKTNLADAFADGTCTKGADFTMNIDFPNCWDGVNLDSPDHKSHMAYPETYKSFQGTWPTIPDQYSSRCPATHPVVLPDISYNIHYTIPDDQAVSRWRLSSDKYDPALPGGLSGHADYFMGWAPKVMQTFIDSCDRAHTDCHAYLLGNNTMLY